MHSPSTKIAVEMVRSIIAQLAECEFYVEKAWSQITQINSIIPSLFKGIYTR